MTKFKVSRILGRGQKLFFVYETVLLIAGAVLSVYPIRYMEKIVNLAVYGKRDTVSEILLWGSVYLFLQILRAFFIAVSDYFARKKQAEIMFSLQIHSFSQLTKVKMNQIRFSDASKMSAALVEDTQYAGENMITAYTELVTSVFTFILGIYFISRINPGLCFLIFPLALISSLIIRRLSGKSFENLTEQRKESTELWKTFEEGILGFLPLRFHQDISYYLKKIESRGMTLKKAMKKQAYLESSSYFFTSSLFMITIGCIMIVSSVFVVKGQITIGGLTAVMMYNNLLSEPLIQLQEIVKKIQKLRVSLSRLAGIYTLSVDEMQEQTGPIDTILIEDAGYLVNGKEILGHVNLNIKMGTSVMIGGKTGAGKTTLVNLITGVYPCSSGRVSYQYQNQSVGYFPKISYMLQDEYLFDDTVYNNILIGNRNAGQKKLEEVVSICGLEHVITAHPGKIGANGKNLSGGERKRVLLARTILDEDSDIFVFDEMSASLDEDTYIRLWKSIDTFLQRKIRIYIEHNDCMQAYVDELIVI